MAKSIRKGKSKARVAARKAFDKVESRVTSAVGRRVLRKKTKAVADLGKKAAKAGLIFGAAAAAGVAAGEIARRRKG